MFKKMFFPQLYLVKEEQQSDEDREVNTKKKEMKFNKNKNVQVMEERVLKLEKEIKIRLGNNF
jgi:predicted DNA binding CopG/RHH family protein